MRIHMLDLPKNCLNRWTLSLVVSLLIVAFPANAQQQEEPASHSTAAAFKSLWRACILKSDLTLAQAALSEFKTIVAGDKKLSGQLRESLITISINFDTPSSLALKDNQPHPAISVIDFLVRPSTFDKDRERRYQLFGRITKNIEYGQAQQSYDSYLSEIHAYNSLVATVSVPKAPELDIKKLVQLQSIFTETGDEEWEIKSLRWQLATIGLADLASPEATAKWARLGQLETGTAGELDRFLAQASLIARDGTVLQPDTAALVVKPVVITTLTTEQCYQAIQLMIDMKMPWEAFLFLQHSKKKWNINPAGSLSKIKESWTRDISGPSNVWEKYYSRPWFISSVKVIPSTSLDEFLKELETRPNLPK